MKNFYIEMDGTFVFTKDTNKTFNFNLTWAAVELILDAKTVKKKVTKTGSVHHLFSAGKHHVTIRAYNDEVSPFCKIHININDYEPVLEVSEVTKKLKGLFAKDINVYYTSAWSDKKVYLTSSKKPTILFINSRQGPTWKFSNAKDANLQAIIYSGAGNRFEIDKKGVGLYRVKRLPELQSIAFDLSGCKELPAIGLTCTGSPKVLNRTVRKIIGRNITGFSKATKTVNMVIPEIKLDEKVYKKLSTLSKKVVHAKSKVKERDVNPFMGTNGKFWSEILKVKNIPKNRFRAFYMDATNPTKIVASKTVSTISLDFDREKMNGIDANHFTGLWVGDFYFKKESKREFSFSLSWARIRLIVDGKVVYEGGESKNIPYTFSKGKHRVEVEYNSNYGHVGFLFTMKAVAKQLDALALSELDKNAKVYVVGAYSSRRDDHTLDLFVKKNTGPVVLVLSSHSPVQWNILHARNVKAVIFNASKPGSSVVTDNQDVKVYEDKRLPYVARLVPHCYDKPIKRCESKYAFKRMVQYTQRNFWKRPDGFSSLQSPSLSTKNLERFDPKLLIVVPQKELIPSDYMRMRKMMKTLDQVSN